MQSADALMVVYRSAVVALQKAMAMASRPELSATERLEQVKALKPLWARHDNLRQKIEAVYR